MDDKSYAAFLDSMKMSILNRQVTYIVLFDLFDECFKDASSEQGTHDPGFKIVAPLPLLWSLLHFRSDPRLKFGFQGTMLYYEHQLALY